jgi:hypothetical protein
MTKSLKWKPSRQQRTFIENYSKYLDTGRAALFVGAGLSRSAGYVDWRGLLDGIAKELDLDINKEHDLVAVAQFFLNAKKTRNGLNEAIIEEFKKDATLTNNHYLLARLPIRSIWTTNYDRLIESAFDSAGRGVDVKLEDEDFALWHRGDTILYKMHGDVQQPHKAVLTKDDYETYGTSHPLFLQHLKMDLITKHFLFLGFSFTDPNLERVFSAVRVLSKANGPQHFAIIRDVKNEKGGNRRRMELWIEDLKRFNIETILISEYSQIELLLEAISRFVHRKSIFVSGSSRGAALLDTDPQATYDDLARTLGTRLISDGFNVVSGFGVGLGEQVVLGALKALHSVNALQGRVTVRPFPTAPQEASEQRQLNTRTREDLIARSGTVIFIGGSQIADGDLLPSRGVLEEFEIATRLKRFIIPVGSTGHASAKIWKTVSDNFDSFYPSPDRSLREYFDKLALSSPKVSDLIDTIMAMVRIAASSD